MNAQVSIETVSPKMASEWLKTPWPDQRKISQNHTNRLGREMSNGRFRLSCDAIALINGKVGNGQHRLAAVMKSGQSSKFIVLRTDDEKIFEVLDCGKQRSIADVIKDIPHSGIVSSAARLVIAYDFKLLNQSGYDMDNQMKPILRSGILDYIAKHSGKLADQAAFVCSQYTKSRIVGTTIATAFLHIASRNGDEAAREYIANVYSGERLDASKDFRDRMIKQLAAKSRLRQAYVFALMIKAYKSFLNGTRPGTLKMVDGEKFPQI